MEPRPRSPYAASKLAGENYCQAMWRAWGVRSLSLRYFNVYGPGQDPESEYAAVVPRFIVACLSGDRPVVYGDGEQARDFTFIDDVVEANVLAMRAPSRAFGHAFNIGGGADPTSINRLLQMVAEMCDVDPEVTNAPPREGDLRFTKADVSKARRVLGYRPAIAIDEGLRRTVASFRAAVPTSSL
jgi:UDP-glucose 4-epimerase